MRNRTKVQCDERNGREQWHVSVPSSVAQTMEFLAGENIEWIIVDKDTVVLRRTDEPFLAVKKNSASVTRLF